MKKDDHSSDFFNLAKFGHIFTIDIGGLNVSSALEFLVYTKPYKYVDNKYLGDGIFVQRLFFGWLAKFVVIQDKKS